MQRIPLPVIAYSDIEVTLSGVRYLFTYRYNSRNLRWRVDIRDSDNEYVVKGLSLIEETSPTAHLRCISLNEGLLVVVRLNADLEPAGRDNLGINKNYEFVYVTNAELAEGG